MLHHRPELVHMDRAVRDYPDAPATFDMTEVTMGDVMRTGVFGDATVATAAKGERWLAMAADRAAELWTGFLTERGVAAPHEGDAR
jgi:creatinine amidohydrolase